MRALALVLIAVSFPAWAEEELGLDLSEAEVPEEFRPAIAVIGVTAVTGSEDREVNRAKLMEAELSRQITGNNKYGRVMRPNEVADALGPEAAAARACAEVNCLKALAEKLSVQRVITGNVARGAGTSLLTVLGADTTLTAALTSTVESGEKAEKQQIGGFAGIQGKSQAQKDKDFVKKASPVFNDVLSKLSTPLGKLVVDCFENTAETTLNGKVVGKGSFSLLLPHGPYKLATSGEGFLPFEKEVKIESMKVESVRVTLVARPLEKPVAPVATSTSNKPAPIFTRPGFFVAAAGVIAIGVAIGLGASTLSVNSDDTNNDGVVNVSRAEVKSAQGAAIAADILYGVGGAAIVGGGLWMILAPGKTPAATRSVGPRPSDEPEVGGGSGWTFMVGASGSF
jgi:hypothetical protein